MRDEVRTAAAQSPRLDWCDNTDGVRDEQEAVHIARHHGVVIHEDIRIVWDWNGKYLEPDQWARYGGWRSDQRVVWDDFLVQGRLPVKVRPAVLRSDEAIVAVLGHEMFEINELRRLLADGRSISGVDLYRLIAVDIVGNLHDRAWDEADRLVQAMRKER